MDASTDTLARLLRTRRLALGKSLEDVRRETRVPLAALEALEAGRLKELPTGPVTKGFAVAYARSVGIDVAYARACWPTPKAPLRDSAPPPLRSTWRWVVLLALLLVPLWFLGRWLSSGMRDRIGETGQASWQGPHGPAGAELRRAQPSPAPLGAATLRV